MPTDKAAIFEWEIRRLNSDSGNGEAISKPRNCHKKAQKSTKKYGDSAAPLCSLRVLEGSFAIGSGLPTFDFHSGNPWTSVPGQLNPGYRYESYG
jgi:hypothetical protein